MLYSELFRLRILLPTLNFLPICAKWCPTFCVIFRAGKLHISPVKKWPVFGLRLAASKVARGSIKRHNNWGSLERACSFVSRLTRLFEKSVHWNGSRKLRVGSWPLTHPWPTLYLNGRGGFPPVVRSKKPVCLSFWHLARPLKGHAKMYRIP